ncbi:hypothetical protein [Oerskovia turbata]
MDLILDPPRAVGPLAIGMSSAEASRVLRDLPGRSKTPGGPAGGTLVQYESGLSISFGVKRERLVDSIEVWRPEREVRILLGALDIFGTPADEVTTALAATTRIDVENEGASVVAPDLLLALWRPFVPENPDDEDGRYFSSVLVAAPGYYDGPTATEAPAPLARPVEPAQGDHGVRLPQKFVPHALASADALKPPVRDESWWRAMATQRK